MPNYKMILQYDGTRYKGWQRQENTDATIQGKLQNILQRMTGEEADVQGSGRTDAGVHAKGQVAHVHLQNEWQTEKIKDYVNSYLPEDIAVLEVEEVEERFHARLLATSKTYEYRIAKGKKADVFQRKYVHVIEEALDVAVMNEAAKKLIGTHDFKAFCGNPKMKKSTVRTVYEIEITETAQEIRLRFTGNGFLQNMVRILTGTLVEVGLGQRSPKEMEKILESKKRENAGATMPAKGLTLLEVRYR